MPHIPGHNINPFAGYVPTPPPMTPRRFPMAGEYPGEQIYGNLTPTVTTPLPDFNIGSELGLPVGVDPVYANDPTQAMLTPEQRIAAGLPAQTGSMGRFEDITSTFGTLAGRLPELGRAIGNIVQTNPRQYYNMYKTMTDPEATTKQKLLTPVMPALDVLSAAEQAVFKPFYSAVGGRTIGNIPGVYEGESYESLLKKYRNQGYNSIEASEKAFEEIKLADINNPFHKSTEKGISKLPSWASFLNYVNPETFGVKGAIELIFDPFAITGIGAVRKPAQKLLTNLAKKGKKAPIDNAAMRAADKPSTYFPDIPKEQPVRPVPKTLRREETYFPDKRPMTFFDEVPLRTPTAPLRQAEQYFPDTPPKKTPPKKEPNPVYDNLSKELDTKQLQLKTLTAEQSKRRMAGVLSEADQSAINLTDQQITQLQKDVNNLKEQLKDTPKDTFFDSQTDTPIDPQFRSSQYFPDTGGIKSETPESPTTYFSEPTPKEIIEPLGRDVESYFPQHQLIEDLKKTKLEDQPVRVPREGILDDAVRPGEELGSQFEPMPGVQVVKPSVNAMPFLGESLSGGIVTNSTGKFDNLRNWLGGILGDNNIPVLNKLGIPSKVMSQAMPAVKAVFRRAEEILQAGRSKGRSFKDQYVAELNQLEKTEGVNIYMENDTPLFRHLQGIDETLIDIDGNLIPPTVSDIAARYPKYVNNLTPQELEFFDWLKTNLDPYNKYMFSEGYLEKGLRADIVDEGFYIPRGGQTEAITEGIDAFAKTDLPELKYIKKPKGLGTTYLPLDQAKFKSQAQGVVFNDGIVRYRYMNTGDAISDYIEAIHRLEANTLRKAGLESVRINGRRIGVTYHTYLNDNFGKGIFPDSVEVPIDKMRQARKNLINLRRLSGSIDDRLIRKVEEVLQNPFTDKSNVAEVIDDIKQALTKASQVQGGRYVGTNKTEITKLINQTKNNIDDLRPKYDQAINYVKDMHQATGRNLIELPGLSGHVWIDEIAEEMGRVIKNDPTLKLTRAGQDQIRESLKAANGISRGLTSTMDNSANNITLLFAATNNPTAWGRAWKASFLSWVNPNVMGNKIRAVNKQLQNDFGITVNDLYNNGLHHSGGAMEFAIGQEGTNIIARAGQQLQALEVPVPFKKKGVKPFDAANRAFSNAGDIMRLEVAMHEMQRAGVTKLNAKQFINTGQMRDMTVSVNRMTGYSSRAFGGSVTEYFLYAARFFATRVENLTMGIWATGKGFTPGMQLSLQERIQRASLVKHIGYGTGLTFTINYMLGNETDTNPVREITKYKEVTRDGEKVKVAYKTKVWNSNFMTIRFNNRDYNLFGPSMQTVRFFGSLGLAAQQKDPEAFLMSLRGISSPIVARAYDGITGKTFEGKPLWKDKISYKDSLVNFMESFMPFALQDMGTNVLEAKQKTEREGMLKGVGTGIQSIAGDFISISNSPMTMGDLLQDSAKLNFDENFHDLEGWQKDIVRQSIEGELSPFQEEAKKRVNEGSEYFKQLDKLKKSRMDKLIEAANDKSLSAYEFYGQYMDINKEAITKQQMQSPEYEDSGEGVNDPDPNIRALARYYTLKDKAQTPAGRTNWDTYNTLKMVFMRSLTEEQKNYILRNINRSPIPYEVRAKLIQTRRGRLEWQEIMQSHVLRQNELTDNPQQLQMLNDIFYGNTFRKEN